MTDIDEKPKRKNDDKPKRGLPDILPRGVLLTIALVAACGIIGVVLWALRPAPAPNLKFPAAHLAYNTEAQAYELNLQTGERAVIAHRPDPAKIPQLSPDNKWQAFWQTSPGSKTRILIFQENQKPETQHVLGTFTGPASALSWSPDSTHLIFSAFFDYNRREFCNCDAEIFVVSRETSQFERLTHNATFEASPVYSPDGTSIVYTATTDRYHANRLYIMNLATKSVRLLTPDQPGYTPVWSPDGQWIAFMTTTSDRYSGDIWIIRPNGTDAQPVIIGTSYDANPGWLPQ